MKTLPALLAAAALSAFALPAAAAAIVADTGWSEDELQAANAATLSSPWTFTLTGPGVFRVTDAYIPGDSYWLYDGATLLATSAFVAKSSLDASFFDSAWTDAAYSKLEYALGAGSYSLTIKGDGVAGLPAGLGVRLDTLTSAVPEPTTWAFMIVGFGLLGGAVRASRQKAGAATFA